MYLNQLFNVVVFVCFVIYEMLNNDTLKLNNSIIVDPNAQSHKIDVKNLTDHFYDTGIYESEWKQSKFYKTNPPFMRKMSF